MINWRLRRALIDKKITQADIIVEAAEALGVTRQHVRNVITGKTSKRVEEYIAMRFGLSREYLFPKKIKQIKHRKILSQGKQSVNDK
jgi:transcriptional regulator with XRE-family HTH domain